MRVALRPGSRFDLAAASARQTSPQPYDSSFWSSPPTPNTLRAHPRTADPKMSIPLQKDYEIVVTGAAPAAEALIRDSSKRAVTHRVGLQLTTRSRHDPAPRQRCRTPPATGRSLPQHRGNSRWVEGADGVGRAEQASGSVGRPPWLTRVTCSMTGASTTWIVRGGRRARLRPF